MKPLLTTLAATVMLVASASAQPIADHLKCYKVKDSQPKASYTANLGGLVPESGCLIKVPGNLLCVETTKDITAGTPPGGADNSGPAGRFLCYKLKCPKATLPAVQWHDQFGNRQLTPSTPKILCAPEIVAASTTTTETSTTTTTTACPAGDTFCGTACVNTATDPANCGSCGTVCLGGESCTLSVCTCPAGTILCGTSCVNPSTDSNNCGTCGHVCAQQAASTCGTTGQCSAGACALYAAGTACGPSMTCNGSGVCIQTTTTTTTTTSSTTTSTLVAGSLCAPCASNTDCLNSGNPLFSPCHSFAQGQRCTKQCTTDADCGFPVSPGACDTTQGVCKCSS